MIRLRIVDLDRATNTTRLKLRQLTRRNNSIMRDVLDRKYVYSTGRTICVAAYCTKRRRYVGWSVYHPRSEDINVFVAPTYRRNGIGRRLVARLLHERLKHRKRRSLIMTYSTRLGEIFWSAVSEDLNNKYKVGLVI